MRTFFLVFGAGFEDEDGLGITAKTQGIVATEAIYLGNAFVIPPLVNTREYIRPQSKSG